MRAFRPKSFRQKAASEANHSDGLTDEQHKAMVAEFDRRITNFTGKWLLCRNRGCRRRQQCLGPPFSCHNNGAEQRWSTRLYRRLKRDIVRKPPRM